MRFLDNRLIPNQLGNQIGCLHVVRGKGNTVGRVGEKRVHPRFFINALQLLCILHNQEQPHPIPPEICNPRFKLRHFSKRWKLVE